MLSQVGVSECMLKNQKGANQKVLEGIITPYDVTRITVEISVNKPTQLSLSSPHPIQSLLFPNTNKRHNLSIGYEPKTHHDTLRWQKQLRN